MRALKGLKSLIRERKWKVDEKRRAIAALQSFRDDMLGQIQALESDLREEAKRLEGDAIGVLYSGPHAQHMQERKKNLEASVAETEKQLEEAQAKLAELFRELKRLEVALEHREAAHARRRDRRERIEMDEIASRIGARKSNTAA